MIRLPIFGRVGVRTNASNNYVYDLTRIRIAQLNVLAKQDVRASELARVAYTCAARLSEQRLVVGVRDSGAPDGQTEGTLVDEIGQVVQHVQRVVRRAFTCLLYTSPSPRDS